MSKKQSPEEPSTQEAFDICVEVEIEGIHVKKATSPGSIFLPVNMDVEVFDYYKTCPRDYLESDNEGNQCRRTIYRGPKGAKTEGRISISLYIREGDIFRVLLPPATKLTIRKLKDGNEVKTLRFVRKKK